MTSSNPPTTTSSIPPVARGPAPSLGRAFGWALSGAGVAGAIDVLRNSHSIKRWLTAVHDLHVRGLVEDERHEFLRVLRPYVHRDTDVPARVRQLIDHYDWLETAFQPAAYEQLMRGQGVVIADLPLTRGYDSVRVELRHNARLAPEGELLVTLVLRRSPEVQPSPVDAEVAVLACTRLRLGSSPSLAIGGVRGQRDAASRISTNEVSQVLQGWKTPVFMVRVAQELARFWGLQLVGLDPGSHRLQEWRYQWRRQSRESMQRIYASYQALWDHFGAKKATAPGWMRLPLNSDDKLAATALSPEKRARQTRRSDYWIRVRELLRTEFRAKLVRLAPERGRGGVTQDFGPRTLAPNTDADWDELDFQDSDDVETSRLLDSGPASLH